LQIVLATFSFGTQREQKITLFALLFGAASFAVFRTWRALVAVDFFDFVEARGFKEACEASFATLSVAVVASFAIRLEALGTCVVRSEEVGWFALVATETSFGAGWRETSEAVRWALLDEGE
jgi:hypothetical protein